MMRFIGLLLITILAGCAKDETPEIVQSDIVGKWLRVEEYVNPGNGGRWVQTADVPPVTVEFTAEGKINSNHPLYATYTSYRKFGKDSIQLVNPVRGQRFTTYSLDNGKLTILYACREGCGDRFTRQ